jgi:prepilin-type N-terminal cleavage/methylation domain-containing protein
MRRAFTLIELIVVISIIVILSAIAIPATKMLMKSNGTAQGANLVRTMIGQARTMALSQHRAAGVVFFEETPAHSMPVNSNATAMQIFVEAYNQQDPAFPPVTDGSIYFVEGSAREYLPSGIKVATLNDAQLNAAMFTAGENSASPVTRVIIFDANGQLALRGGLRTTPTSGPAGSDPQREGDWNFLNAGVPTVTAPFSSPGFILYSKSEYDSQTFADDAKRSEWLRNNSNVVIVNGYTGGIIQ